MPTCDFNKVPKQLLHIFRTPFPKSTSGWLLLPMILFSLHCLKKIYKHASGDFFFFFFFFEHLIIMKNAEKSQNEKAV